MVPHHGLTIVLYSMALKNGDTWNGKGQLGYSGWTAQKHRGQTKCNPALLLVSDHTQATQYSYVIGGKKPHPPKKNHKKKK